MAAARTHSLESHLPGGFVMDKGAFVGPVHVMEERAVDTSSRLAFSDVRTVYRGYTPPKPSSEELAEGLDEKADALMESPTSWTPDFSAGKGRVNESPLSAASSCTVASSSPDAPERPRPVLIVIDNDECIGSWGDLSMLYTVFTHVLHQEPPVELFARLLNDTGCVRPGLRDLYTSVLEMKAEGSVCGVYMCTAARDTVGWVTFLRRVLEMWYGRAVYDGVIEGNMIHEWHTANGTAPTDTYGSVFKNMHQVRQFAGVHPDTPVIAVDDRPDNILHGEAVRVPPYAVAVNLIEVARLFVPEWNQSLEQRYGHTLQESWRTYQRNPARYTVAWMDVAMPQSAATLRSKVAALVTPTLSDSDCRNLMHQDDDAKESL